MLEAWSGFLGALKQTSPTVFLGLAFSCGLILFGNVDLLENLGLLEFRNSNKGYIGTVFVGSASLVVAQSIAQCGKFILSVFKQQRERKKIELDLKNSQKMLHELTPDEKAYLVGYIFQDKGTQYFLIEDGIAQGLAAKQIIYRASQIGNMVDGWAFNIQPWARDYLRANKNLLEGFNPHPQGPPRW